MICLAELTTREAARVAADPRAVVLLPLGAIEQHGPHLPLVVDLLVAETLAAEIAPYLKRAGYRLVLAPALPYGVSTLAVGWSGTVSLSPATFRRLVVEVVRSLARSGFRRFVLTNYQADPDPLGAMAAIRRALMRPPGLTVLFAGFAPGPAGISRMINPRVRRAMKSPRPDAEWHSGELETALVLWRRPALVRRALARRLPPIWVDFHGRLRAGARNFRELGPGGAGYFGWPATARAATGRTVMKLRARLIAAELLAALDPPARASRRASIDLSAPGKHRARKG